MRRATSWMRHVRPSVFGSSSRATHLEAYGGHTECSQGDQGRKADVELFAAELGSGSQARTTNLMISLESCSSRSRTRTARSDSVIDDICVSYRDSTGANLQVARYVRSAQLDTEIQGDIA